MMKIYVCHSTGFDYQNELYKPLINSVLYNKNEIILPHKDSNLPTDSKKIIQNCDLVLAEVSHPSTGMGIELGWANTFGKHVIAFYQEGTSPSSALQVITKKVVSYSKDDLIDKITKTLSCMEAE